MSLEIAWKQNILVTDSNLLKLLLVVLGFGSQTFICGFSRQNICSVRLWAPGKCHDNLCYQNYYINLDYPWTNPEPQTPTGLNILWLKVHS